MLLNDKVPFRMQWPQDTDLQVNGMKLNFTSTNLLISLLFLMFEISSCLEAFMRAPPPPQKKKKKFPPPPPTNIVRKAIFTFALDDTSLCCFFWSTVSGNGVCILSLKIMYDVQAWLFVLLIDLARNC
jgi:hypothetical protein